MCALIPIGSKDFLNRFLNNSVSEQKKNSSTRGFYSGRFIRESENEPLV